MEAKADGSSRVLFKRLKRACGFVALIVVAAMALAGGSERVLSGKSDLGIQPNPSVSMAWERLQRGESEYEVLKAQGFKTVSADEVPSWFIAEVLDLEAAIDASGACTQDETVWWLRLAGSASDVEEQLAKSLQDKGWMKAENRYGYVTTFIKEKGECIWAMIQLSQGEETRNPGAEEVTGVVLHIKRR